MSDYDDDYLSREEGEIGSRATAPDDRCNHLACILWDMRSRANLRKPFTPRPKPEYIGGPVLANQTNPKDCNIGKRRKYSHTIMRGIFQLQRNGISPNVIANMIGMPLADVKKIMEKKTDTSTREFMRVCQQAYNPSTGEIIRRLAVEADHVYGANGKIL